MVMQKICSIAMITLLLEVLAVMFIVHLLPAMEAVVELEPDLDPVR